MSRGLLTNPIVQVTLALVVILVIATLTFASAISGALNTLRVKLLRFRLQNIAFMCVQTAEKLRKPLVSLISNHCGRTSRTRRTNLGITEDGRIDFLGLTK